MKILLAYNGTDIAQRALDEAINRSSLYIDKVFVINSISGDKHSSIEDLQAARSNLEFASQKLAEKNIEHETKLLTHDHHPGEVIIEYSKRVAVDEIVIGIENKSRVGKFIFGSTAQYVILHAACPILCVK